MHHSMMAIRQRRMCAIQYSNQYSNQFIDIKERIKSVLLDKTDQKLPFLFCFVFPHFCPNKQIMYFWRTDHWNCPCACRPPWKQKQVCFHWWPRRQWQSVYMFTMKHTQFDSVFLMTEEMEDWMEDDDDDLLQLIKTPGWGWGWCLTADGSTHSLGGMHHRHPSSNPPFPPSWEKQSQIECIS